MSDRVRRTTEQRAGQCGAKIKYASQGSAEAMMTRTRRSFRVILTQRNAWLKDTEDFVKRLRAAEALIMGNSPLSNVADSPEKG